MNNRKNSDYKTIGAISGYFPKRAKTPKGLSAEERGRIASALSEAAARGMDALATRRYVIERMTFDHPTVPASQVVAAMGST